jgi:membrane protease YdiL (CAAX protease family)
MSLVVFPIACLALLLLFRTSLFLFYYFVSKKKKGSLWMALAFFWGIWSLPFWGLCKLDLRDLEKDLMRFKLLSFTVDRSSLLNTVCIYIAAQVISGVAVLPLILIWVMMTYDVITMETLVRPWMLLLVVLYLNVSVIVIIYLWGIKPGHIDLKGMGMEKKRIVLMILLGIALGVLLISIASVGEWILLKLIPDDLPYYLNPDQGFIKSGSTLDYLLLLLGVGIIAPIGEEIFFRGYMFSLLQKKRSTAFAIIASSLVFAAFHVNILLFPIITVAGIIICYIRYKSGSIWPCVMIHMMNNVLAVTYLSFSG